MSTIDNRVVRMEFENANFERNAKESMKTLEKLDKSLEFKNGKKSFKDVEEAAAACNFKPLMEAVDTVKVQFTALGSVANRVMQRITDSVLDTGKKMLKSLTIDPIMSGYSKYEEKTASVQTLLNSTGLSLDEVNGYLSKLMWFSDETSYSFTQMTSALATMTSAGGDVAKIVPMLQGVANATAFAGKGAREFSGAIFNLNQSYSGGFLSYMDYNSLDRTYNIFSKQLKQAFIDNAKALGKLDKEGRTASGTLVDISNFASTLSERWADRDVMEASFGWFNEVTDQAYALVKAGKYATASDAYDALAGQFNDIQYAAARSAQEAKSFTEAIDSVKDAVSSGWMQTFEYLFGNYEQSKVLWTDLANSLYDIFAEPANQRNSVLKEALTDTWGQFQAKITDAGIEWEKFQDRLIEYGKANGKITEEEIKNAKSLEDVIKSGWLNGNIVSEVLKGFTKGIQTKSMEERIADANKIAREVMRGDWGKGDDRRKRLIEAGYDAAEVQRYVNALYQKGTLAVEDLGKAEETLSDITDEQKKKIEEAAAQIEKFDKLIASFKDPSGRDKMLQGIKNILNELLPILDAFKLAWTDVFGELSADNITEFINKFVKMSETFKLGEGTLQAMRDILGGIFAIIKFVVRVAKGLVKAFSPFFKLITRMAGRVVRSFGKIGAAVRDALSGTVIEKIADAFSKIFEKLVSVINALRTFVKRFVSVVKELIPETTIFSDIGEAIQKTFGGTILEGILSFLEGIRRKLLNISKTDIKDWFDKVGKKIGEFRSKIVSVWKAIKKFLNPVIQRLKQVLQPVVNYLTQNVVPAISGFVTEIINSDHPLQTLWEKLVALLDPVTGLWDTFKNLIEKLDFSKWGKEVGGAIEVIWEKIEGFIETVKKDLQGLDLTQIIAIAAIGAIATVVITINKALAGITNLSTSVKTFFDNLVTYIKPAAAKTFSRNVTLVVGSIIALVGAVYLLSTIDDKGDLWNAVGAVATLAVILGALSGGLTLLASKIKLQTAAKMGNLAKGMLAISGAIGVLSLSLFVLSKIKIAKWEQVWQMLALLTGAMAALSISVIAISRFGTKMALKGVSLLLVASAFLIMAAAFSIIGGIKINNPQNLLEIIGLITVILIAVSMVPVGGILKIVGLIVATIAGAIGSLLMLVVLIDHLKTFDASGLQKNLDSILAMCTILLAFFVVLAIASKYVQKGIKSAALISLAVLILVADLWALAKVVEGVSAMKIRKSTLTTVQDLAEVLVIMTVVLGLAARIGGNGGFAKLGVGLLLAVGAIALLALLLDYISEIIAKNSGEKIAKAVNVILALSLVVDGLMLAAGGAAKLGGKTGMVYMIAALGMIIAIVTAFYALQLIPVDQLLKTAASMAIAMGAIGLVMVAMAGAVKMANNAGKGSGKGIFAMIAMIVPLIFVAASLFVLATLPWSSLLVAAVALVGVMTLMALVTKIASKSAMGGVALLAMAVPILAIAAALTILAAIPWQGLLKAGIALLATMAVMALIGSLASVTILGATAIVILSAALLVASAAFIVFTLALERLQSVDFATIGSGLRTILGPLAILAAIGLLGSIGGVGLIVLSGGMLALAGAMAVLSGSAILAADALLFAKGAWDFLSGKGTESWELAVQMRNEANALKEESDNMQQSIDEATEKTTESIDNYGEETANAYEQAGEKIAEAQAEAQIDTAPQETVPDLQNEVASGGGTTEATTADAAAAMGMDFDISKFTGGFGEQIKTWFSGSDAMAALTEGFGNLFSGLDFSSIGSSLNLEGLGAMMVPQINSEENAAAVTEGMKGMFSGSTEAGAAAGTESGNAYAGAAAAAMISQENTMTVTTSGQDLGNASEGGFRSVSPNDSGKWFVEGIKVGIGNEASSLLTYIESLANECINKLNITWSVRSPSRETQWSAMQFVNGLVVGIRDNQKYAIYAIEDLAGDTLATLNRVLDSDQDGTIRPVLDMSEIVTQMDTFGSDSEWKPVITPVLDMSGVEPGLRNLNAIAGYRAPKVTEMNAGMDAGDNTDSPVTFNQYNYSPKALTRLEIYRQTKNQLSMMKGVARKKV